MPVIFPFFVAGAVDGIDIAADASLDTATGPARAAAFLLFLFILVAAGDTMGGRAGGMMMTLKSSPADSAM